MRDDWGRPLIIHAWNDAYRGLYSVGPDGKDEQGRGDDVIGDDVAEVTSR